MGLLSTLTRVAVLPSRSQSCFPLYNLVAIPSRKREPGDRHRIETVGTLMSTESKEKQLGKWIITTLRQAAWAPFLVLGFYALGLTFQLFKRFPPLDIPTHFMGGVVITYFYRVAIRHSQKLVGEIPYPIQVFFAITCTATTTIFWEFYENFLDYFAGTHMVRGVQDTIVDLFVGLMGALALSLFYRRR